MSPLELANQMSREQSLYVEDCLRRLVDSGIEASRISLSRRYDTSTRTVRELISVDGIPHTEFFFRISGHVMSIDAQAFGENETYDQEKR